MALAWIESDVGVRLRMNSHDEWTLPASARMANGATYERVRARLIMVRWVAGGS